VGGGGNFRKGSKIKILFTRRAKKTITRGGSQLSLKNARKLRPSNGADIGKGIKCTEQR